MSQLSRCKTLYLENRFAQVASVAGEWIHPVRKRYSYALPSVRHAGRGAGTDGTPVAEDAERKRGEVDEGEAMEEEVVEMEVVDEEEVVVEEEAVAEEEEEASQMYHGELHIFLHLVTANAGVQMALQTDRVPKSGPHTLPRRQFTVITLPIGFSRSQTTPATWLEFSTAFWSDEPEGVLAIPVHTPRSSPIVTVNFDLEAFPAVVPLKVV
ncbi:hypothetical protein L226DRAFT_565982 [Lentinus tigrinus ALCF2SS1-7]|uniref:Uncharacterized protein n=1 Tax=Lentinus tigrinus ALCF2SS1-6 TaxID=1328759 RepID=A0A5C2SUU7_9APHY|nr:hypothetical protein L227DRAFT_605644 [Lentinus tigrinus ALCF2SS1-6]RPD81186.1 hypothetical protein L226DRAFT_565982 [Lentinus tigrinus ALCF2SS1-7]